MPSYDYRCSDCQSNFTIEKSMSDDSKPNCTSCGSTNASRIWNAFILTSGSTPDYGQSTKKTQTTTKKSGCGSCSSHSCGTC
jgi:putative FmdB family regulatory protein